MKDREKVNATKKMAKMSTQKRRAKKKSATCTKKSQSYETKRLTNKALGKWSAMHHQKNTKERKKGKRKTAVESQ